MPSDDDDFSSPRVNSVPPESEPSPSEPASQETEEFARLLDASLAPRSHREGETVEGTIVAIGPEVAFVNIGGKGEATIDLEELADPDSDVPVKVGDTVKAVVVSTVGGLKLSHKLARGAATRQRLIDAFQAGLPVEGRVERRLKEDTKFESAGSALFVRSLKSTPVSPPIPRSTWGRPTPSGSSNVRRKAKI